MIVHLPDGRIAQASAAVPSGAADVVFFQGADEVTFTCTDTTEQTQFLAQFEVALVANQSELVLRTNLATTFGAFAITNNPGTKNGGLVVVITADGFRPNGSVTIGAAAVLSFTYVSKTTLIVVTPPGTVGARDVVYTDDRGSTTQVGGYTYN